MSRNYGSLGSRRSAGGAWQWVVIGVLVGFACSITLGLGGIAAGLLYLDVEGLPGRASPTPVVMVITATPVPVTPTLSPTPAPPTPTSMPVQQITAPTPTPTTDPAQVQVEPSVTPTSLTAALPEPAEGSAQTGPGASAVPAALQGLITELVAVDGGTFLMGTDLAEVRAAVDGCVADGGQCQISYGEDSLPSRQVTLDPFQIETTEVTYQQYLTFLNSLGPRSHLNGCDGFPCLATTNETDASNVIFDSANYRVQPFLEQYPVAGVTWYGARAYCTAIGRRLPTEAEWERAARGSDGRIFPWGNEFSGEFAKTSRPVVEENLRGAVQVGSFPLGRSPYGALDMAGNVEEWVNDWYSETYYRQPEASQPNPQGPPAGTQKVLRGGSWATMPFFARTPHRRSLEPDQQTISAGFRCADDAPTPGVNTGVPAPAAAPLGSGAQTAPETIDSAPTLPPTPTTNAPAGQATATLPPLPPGG